MNLTEEILKGGDLKTTFTPKNCQYLENTVIFKVCNCCDKKENETDSRFIYTHKMPVGSYQYLYTVVTLHMCYSCLCRTLDIFYNIYKRYPKLRTDGLEFHSLITDETIKSQFENGFSFETKGSTSASAALGEVTRAREILDRVRSEWFGVQL